MSSLSLSHYNFSKWRDSEYVLRLRQFEHTHAHSLYITLVCVLPIQHLFLFLFNCSLNQFPRSLCLIVSFQGYNGCMSRQNTIKKGRLIENHCSPFCGNGWWCRKTPKLFFETHKCDTIESLSFYFVFTE